MLSHRRYFIPLSLALLVQLGSAYAKDALPMHQGLHEWPDTQGKLILVVGTYQDTVTYRRSYSFYYKEKDDETWNQVPLMGKGEKMQFSWHSASGGDVTLADGVVTRRSDGIYFIQAGRSSDRGYHATGDITVTWYKFTQDDKAYPDGPAFALKPVLTRNYPKSTLKVEEVLSKEALKPSR